MGRDMVVNDE